MCSAACGLGAQRFSRSLNRVEMFWLYHHAIPPALPSSLRCRLYNSPRPAAFSSLRPGPGGSSFGLRFLQSTLHGDYRKTKIFEARGTLRWGLAFRLRSSRVRKYISKPPARCFVRGFLLDNTRHAHECYSSYHSRCRTSRGAAYPDDSIGSNSG